jgi:hypothetical protein
MADIQRVFIVDAKGIRNAGLGVKSYDLDAVLLGVKAALPGSLEIDIPLYDVNASYCYDKPLVKCFVGDSFSANRNMMAVCRILGKSPIDFVFAVTGDSGTLHTYRSLDSALSCLEQCEVSEEACGGTESYCIRLVKLQD